MIEYTPLVLYTVVAGMGVMAGLECVCGDVFQARCDVEPLGAWLLVVMGMALHAWRCCAMDDDETDSESDEEPSIHE